MKNYYSTVDNIVMTFLNIEEQNGFDEITVYFEHPNDNNGFDFAEGKLPNNMIYKSYGFSHEELMQIKKYIRNNAALISEIARKKVCVGIA